MKMNQSHGLVVGAGFAVIACLLGTALWSNFLALDAGGGAGSVQSYGAFVNDLLDKSKRMESATELQGSIKNIEVGLGLGPSSAPVAALRTQLQPLIQHFGKRPKEAESLFLLARKRDLMDGLVNAYRREIPQGDIPVRAAYLNILFDTQASLLNETEEAEDAFLQRTAERVQQLKQLAKDRADGLDQRVAGIEASVQSYTRGLQLNRTWHGELSAIVKDLESRREKIAKVMAEQGNRGAMDQRRFFLILMAASIFAVLLVALLLWANFKFLSSRIATRSEILMEFLGRFGADRSAQESDRLLRELKSDPDWNPLVHSLLEAEKTFSLKYQALVSVSTDMGIPFLVVDAERNSTLWNNSGRDLFNLKENQRLPLEELFTTTRFDALDGRDDTAMDRMHKAFRHPKMTVDELLLRSSGIPFEVLSFPVVSGPLNGGRMYFFREIRNETDRMRRLLSVQLERVRLAVQKMAHEFGFNASIDGRDLPEVAEILSLLNEWKGRIDERETLWKSEVSAWDDQAEKQRTILQGLRDRLNAQGGSLGRALSLTKDLSERDGSLREEANLWKRDLSRIEEQHKRLLADIERQQRTWNEFGEYERRVDGAFAALDVVRRNREASIESFENLVQKVEMVGINARLAKSPERFAERIEALVHESRELLSSVKIVYLSIERALAFSPTGSVAPLLRDPPIGAEQLKSLDEDRIALGRWLENVLDAGRELGEISRTTQEEISNAGLVNQEAIRLGDTGDIVLQQARQSLQRWH
jgi:hypothetical protein